MAELDEDKQNQYYLKNELFFFFFFFLAGFSEETQGEFVNGNTRGNHLG